MKFGRASGWLIAAGCLVAIAREPAVGKEIKTVVLGKRAARGVPAPAMPGKNVPAIKVNTVGYAVGWPKVAIFNVDPTGAVLKAADGSVALQISAARIEARGLDVASQDPVWQVDFSAFDTPGTYTLQVGDTVSDPFVVGDGIYAEAVRAGLKSFYYQRTRTALVAPYATWDGDTFGRAGVSHVHEDVGWDIEDHPEKKRRWKVEAGWHDAGNFDMYVPSTAPTSQALLRAYEWAPDLFGDQALVIPESGNGVPDILDETKWGLRWILSMQQPDGAFRHREAVLGWSPEGGADLDKTERWIGGVSTAATAKAVGVLSMAAGIYAKWDPAFAARCGQAAQKGWQFLQQTEGRIWAENKASEQPLWDDELGNSDVGARFIAAVEYWRQFQDPTALQAARALMSADDTQAGAIGQPSWANISNWGMASLALDERTPAGLRDEARARLLQAADAIAEVGVTDGYRCVSKPSDYYWGHNSNLMEKVHILAVAARLDPARPDYLAAARDQWHWVLGRNPNGFSMITRVGKGPTRVYHMEWGAMEPPPPGFLIGGPNAPNMGFLAPGAPAKALLWQNPSALRSGVAENSLWHWHQSDLWDGGFVPEGEWTDGWWAVNEPDILYSADFVLAAASVHR